MPDHFFMSDPTILLCKVVVLGDPDIVQQQIVV